MSASSLFGRFGTAFLRQFDPETAHSLALWALKSGLVPHQAIPHDARLTVDALGLSFPNPLGLAAGLDKNGEAIDPLLSLGFGFVEIGTLTPLPQAGNPRPRLFRLPEEGALINRLGFNNAGFAAAAERLGKRNSQGILGINIGANKESADRIEDYRKGIALLAPYASYFTINISSPNTPDLRSLQHGAALMTLLSAVLEERGRQEQRLARRLPLLVKLAPDFDEAALEELAAILLSHQPDGLILTNTTLSRDGLSSPLKGEGGGLSGKPLFQRSTIMLAKMRRLVGREMVIIGVGGIASGRDALTKIYAGANLLQLYTALIYEGPGLPARILEELLRCLDQEGLSSISAAMGMAVDDFAAQPLKAP